MKEYNVDFKYVICFNVVEENEEDAQRLVYNKMNELLSKINEGIEYTGKVKGVWLSDVLDVETTYIQEEGMLCEMCEVNDKAHPEGKYCDDCREDFKTSEDDK
jgi:hypothetical protein